MDYAQIRTLLCEATGPGGGGGPNRSFLFLIVGTYIVVETLRKANS